MYGGPIGTHQRSFGQYHPRPFMASPYSRLGVCNLILQNTARLLANGKHQLCQYQHHLKVAKTWTDYLTDRLTETPTKNYF